MRYNIELKRDDSPNGVTCNLSISQDQTVVFRGITWQEIEDKMAPISITWGRISQAAEKSSNFDELNINLFSNGMWISKDDKNPDLVNVSENNGSSWQPVFQTSLSRTIQPILSVNETIVKRVSESMKKAKDFDRFQKMLLEEGIEVKMNGKAIHYETTSNNVIHCFKEGSQSKKYMFSLGELNRQFLKNANLKLTNEQVVQKAKGKGNENDREI
jgi:hypothetical protein